MGGGYRGEVWIGGWRMGLGLERLGWLTQPREVRLDCTRQMSEIEIGVSSPDRGSDKKRAKCISLMCSLT